MFETMDDVKVSLARDRRERQEATSEAARSERNRQLLSAQDFVAGILDKDPSDADAVVLYAQIASRMESWDEAIVRWARVVRGVPASRDRAYHNLCVAYRNLGSFSRARLALSKVRQGVRPEALRLEKEKIDAREAEAVALLLGNRAVQAIAAGEPPAATKSLIDATLLFRMEPKGARSCMEQVAGELCSRRLHRLTAARGSVIGRSMRWVRRSPRRGVDHAEPPRAVFFCGFGWSGSGALFDYYLQSQIAVAPFGSTEIGAFARHWSARRALREINDNRDDAHRALVNFIFQSILGFGGPPAAGADKVLRQSVLRSIGSRARDTAVLAEACTTLYRDGARAARHANQDGVEEAFRAFFDRAIGIKVGPGQVGVTSNCIPAASADLVRLVTRGTALVVFRDPRDQYVSQIYEYKDRQRVSCDGFIRKVRSRMERFSAVVGSMAEPSRVAPVRFEEFVLSPAERERVGELIGIPIDTIKPDQLAYRPEDSVRNVGIHQTYSNRAEIARIEDAFPELLFKV